MLSPPQGICLQPQVWRRGWQRAGWGQEGSYRPPRPTPPSPPLGGTSDLTTSPPPLSPRQPGRFTSSGTGRSTNETQRVRAYVSTISKFGFAPFQERRGVSARVLHIVEFWDTLEGVWSCLVLVEKVVDRPQPHSWVRRQVFSPLLGWMMDGKFIRSEFLTGNTMWPHF